MEFYCGKASYVLLVTVVVASLVGFVPVFSDSATTPTAIVLNVTTSNPASPSAPSPSKSTDNTSSSSNLLTTAVATSSSSPKIVSSTCTTTVPPSTTTTRAAPAVLAKDIEEVKKIIHQHIEPNHVENRLAVNKPTLAPQMTDFSPDTIEARAADATTQFGLNFINNLSTDIKENVVLSPLSMQNLLNMILLGTTDNSTTQYELSKVLGYDTTRLLNDPISDRLKPHLAMRNVFQNILAAAHLSMVPTPAPVLDPELLNTNSGILNSATPLVPASAPVIPVEQPIKPNQPSSISAHLQTSVKEGDTPLSGQLNFTLANLVLTNRDRVELKQEYENDLKSYYNVNVEQFSREEGKESKDSELPLHQRVNNWVKNMTQNQIEKLVEESDLSGDDLIMVLLNAAHFKGRWLHTFNSKATHDGTFYNYGSESSKVKFMRQKSVFGYADFGTASLQNEMFPSDSRTRSSEDAETVLTEDDKSSMSSQSGDPKMTLPHIKLSKEEARRMELTSKLNCSVLMLPFSLNEGQELSMVILLPAKRDGIASLQAALDGPALNEIYKSISEQQVQVELPKFSFEASHDAKETLIKMGLSSIFKETAQLDRMYQVKAKSLGGLAKVDKVIHKAKINVDESGAEAAAASMASIVLRNFIRPPMPIFVADHPFLFVIRHNRSNMPLFMGRVVDPVLIRCSKRQRLYNEVRDCELMFEIKMMPCTMLQSAAISSVAAGEELTRVKALMLALELNG